MTREWAEYTESDWQDSGPPIEIELARAEGAWQELIGVAGLALGESSPLRRWYELGEAVGEYHRALVSRGVEDDKEHLEDEPPLGPLVGRIRALSPRERQQVPLLRSLADLEAADEGHGQGEVLVRFYRESQEILHPYGLFGGPRDLYVVFGRVEARVLADLDAYVAEPEAAASGHEPGPSAPPGPGAEADGEPIVLEFEDESQVVILRGNRHRVADQTIYEKFRDTYLKNHRLQRYVTAKELKIKRAAEVFERHLPPELAKLINAKSGNGGGIWIGTPPKRRAR